MLLSLCVGKLREGLTSSGRLDGFTAEGKLDFSLHAFKPSN